MSWALSDKMLTLMNFFIKINNIFFIIYCWINDQIQVTTFKNLSVITVKMQSTSRATTDFYGFTDF